MARKLSAPAFGLGANLFWVFILIGIYMPFFPVWLESRGMDEAQIGLLLGLAPWARLFINPWAGGLADRLGSPRRVLLGLCLVVILSYVLLLGGWNFWALLAGLVVLGCAFGPIVPLTDAVAVRARDRIDYGKVRSVGSLAFIVASVGGGWLFERLDEDAIIWTMMGGAIVLFIVVLTLLPDEQTGADGATDRTVDPRPVRSLLSSPTFRRFLLTAGVLMGSHAVLYGFGSLHWERNGIGEGTIGLLWSVGVVAEVGLFLAGKRLMERLGARTLMLLAGVGGLGRWLVLGATTSLGALFAAQLLHALTFAALHLGAVAFISQHARTDRTSAAQSLYSGVASGLVFGIGMPTAGWAFKHFGAHAFWGMAGMSVLGCLLAFTIPRHVPVRR